MQNARLSPRKRLKQLRLHVGQSGIGLLVFWRVHGGTASRPRRRRSSSSGGPRGFHSQHSTHAKGRGFHGVFKFKFKFKFKFSVNKGV